MLPKINIIEATPVKGNIRKNIEIGGLVWDDPKNQLMIDKNLKGTIERSYDEYVKRIYDQFSKIDQELPEALCASMFLLQYGQFCKALDVEVPSSNSFMYHHLHSEL